MAKKGSHFQRYSYEFKVKVVEDYLSGNSGGTPAIVKKYGLKSTYQVRAWVKKYQDSPASLSKDLRGSGKGGRPKLYDLDKMSLEEQNDYLRMENAILKSLRALQKK
ncbi:transposase [Streptococcus iniae]|uniref:transposase n=1 Tax=Streptococcus iniae TaxID=1346 RepID=UPI0002E3C3B5|nr:transposase [Streptococcus iniae]ESR08708.1 transposase [Streptococcus iniae IUSA1]RLV27314.1 transposase [Streptococcus iniae]